MTDTPNQYATIDDLAAATGDTIAADDARAIRLLQFASAKIDEYCGQTFPTTEGGEVPLIVTAVCAAAAGRAWMNPAGAQTKTEVTGPFTETTGFGASASTASVPLALRASEKDDLARYKVRRSGVSTISTYRPVPIPEQRWIGVADDGKPFPWPDPDELC